MRLLLGIIVFFIWASICRYGYVCELKQACNPKVEDNRSKTLDLILDDTITYLNDYDQFRFDQDSILPFLNDNNKAYLDSLASVMKSDSTIFLTIVGAYRPNEKDTKLTGSFFEDLGTARADAIRSLLVDRGVAVNNISIDYRASDNESLLAPIGFKLYTDKDHETDEYSQVQNRFKNMNYSGDSNFEKDSPIFQPKDAFKFYADSVKTYFAANPNDTLRIIGHCDIDGTDEYNLELGKQRAENAKQYLIELGVVATIITESKGESAPAFKPADTEINMQKNRRVQFIID